jgi:hypothetical protein
VNKEPLEADGPKSGRPAGPDAGGRGSAQDLPQFEADQAGTQVEPGRGQE